MCVALTLHEGQSVRERVVVSVLCRSEQGKALLNTSLSLAVFICDLKENLLLENP